MPKRAANTQLMALLRQAAWSGQALANAVNTAGAENGIVLRYDRTSIAHWLSGSRPSPLVAALVAEVLSRRLGRVVGLGETGFLALPRPASATEDVAAYLVRLGNTGTTRHGTPHDMIYTISESTPPHIADMAALSSLPTARNRERVGTAQVKAATLMLSAFSDLDLTFGGGRALPALSTYLATDVAAWLRAPATPTAKARLYSAAARLTYLAGWMCFDTNQHGTGQRYYHTAAQLALAGGDTACYAATLRGLSVQAHHLGHHTHALHLAQAAMSESHHVPDIEAAFLAGQLAVAQAACGHHTVARAHLATAERILNRASADNTTIGGYHAGSLLHQRAETLASASDRNAAITALTTSLHCRPPTERRAHAITTARLAELHLDAGHLDRACTTWTTLLDHHPPLSSARVKNAIRTMRARLRPHTHHPHAQTLIKRTTTQHKPPP